MWACDKSQNVDLKPYCWSVTHNEESMTAKLVTEIGNFARKYDKNNARKKNDARKKLSIERKQWASVPLLSKSHYKNRERQSAVLT